LNGAEESSDPHPFYFVWNDYLIPDSLATRDYLLDSDADVVVVTDKLRDSKMWERTATLRRMAPKNVGFDIICYTQEEFERTKEQWEPFIRIV